MTHCLGLNQAALCCRRRKILSVLWLWLSSLSHHWQLYFNMKLCLKGRALGTNLSALYKWGDAVNAFHSRELGAKRLSQQWRQAVSQHKKYCLQLHSACPSAGQTHIFQSQRKVTCSSWGPKQRMPEWQILIAYMDRKGFVLVMTTYQALSFPKCVNPRNKLCWRWCLMLAWIVGTIMMVVFMRSWWQKIGIFFLPLRLLVNSYRDKLKSCPRPKPGLEEKPRYGNHQCRGKRWNFTHRWENAGKWDKRRRRRREGD